MTIAKLKWFIGANKDTIKSVYKKLVAEYHPDTHQTEFDKYNAIMAEINEEYSLIEAGVIKLSSIIKTKTTTEINPEMQEVIDKLMNINGLIIEIVGTWIWIGGNTYANKETIKQINNVKYSKSHKKWYWHSNDETHKRRGTNLTFEEIEELHGIKGCYKSKGNAKIATN